MNLKYYEKLIIMIVIFLGVTIGTGAIIGQYVKTVNSKKVNPNKIVLETINVLDNF